jgi:hypothetical protein
VTILPTAKQSANCVEFLLESWLPGVMRGQSEYSFEFALGERYDLRLLIRPTDERSGTGITIETCGSFPATLEQIDFAEALLARKRHLIPYAGMPFKLPYLADGEVKIDLNGIVKPGFDLPSWMLPPSIRSLCRQAEIVLLDGTAGFVGLLSRQFDLSLPTGIIKYHNLCWSFSKEIYQAINGFQDQEEHDPVFTIEPSDGDWASIQTLLDSRSDINPY